MKKLMPFVIVAIVMAAAVFTLQSFEVRTGSLDGTNVNVGPFTTLNVEVPFDVFFSQGAAPAVRVEGDQTVVDKLEFQEKNKSLTIRFKDGIKSSNYKNTAKIYITTPEIENINISGSGSFYTTNQLVNEKQLNFALAGSGKIEADVHAPKLQLDIAGSGDTEIQGKAEKVYVSIAGSGDFDGDALVADEVNVDVAGSGNAYVFAKEKVDASIAGSGDVYYSGEPEHITADVAGSGNVRPHK